MDRDRMYYLQIITKRGKSRDYEERLEIRFNQEKEKNNSKV